MVARPQLKVLSGEDDRVVKITPRSEELLQEAVRLLHIPPEVALQLALTHLVACVQLCDRVHIRLPFDPIGEGPGGHKSGGDADA